MMTRTVKSRPGLSQERALISLQEHPDFRPGTKIAGLKREGQRWVATLIEPKTSADDEDGDPEPKNETGEPVIPDIAEDVDDEKDSESDGPDSPLDKIGEPKEHIESEEETLGQIKSLLEKVIDALGIDAGEDGGLPKGPDEIAPPLDAAPPPPKPAPKPDRPNQKLKPGDVPPGGTPLGAPAFSSIQEMAKHIPSFSASTTEAISIADAKAELESIYAPYKVKQAKRSKNDGRLHALLTVR